jgi:epidermal growth factor receptor substrate 15
MEIAAPLPKFDGINMPVPAATTTFQTPIPAQNSGPIRVPPLAPDRVAEYARLFERAGAQNGLLQGVYMKRIFQATLILYRGNC